MEEERVLDDMGSLVADGKTKTLFTSSEDPFTGYCINKDVVTWGNVHSMRMAGKGGWSTTVNHNLFEVFRRHGLPVAYLGRVGDRIFKTELCDMLSFEVVACGIVDAKSSFRKRNPEIPPETFYDVPVVQFHLKTSGKTYRGRELPEDDPLMIFTKTEVQIYLPGKPIREQKPIFVVPLEEAPYEFLGFELIDEMAALTKKGFLVARHAYEPVGGRLYDGKWEFGIARRPALAGKLLMADVFDPDAMRLLVNGQRADKQPIRNGGEAAFEAQVQAYKLAVATSELLN